MNYYYSFSITDLRDGTKLENHSQFTQHSFVRERLFQELDKLTSCLQSYALKVEIYKFEWCQSDKKQVEATWLMTNV